MQGPTEERFIVKWAPCVNIFIVIIIKFTIRIEDSSVSVSIIRLSTTRSCLARAWGSLVILATNYVAGSLRPKMVVYKDVKTPKR